MSRPRLTPAPPLDRAPRGLQTEPDVIYCTWCDIAPQEPGDTLCRGCRRDVERAEAAARAETEAA